MSDYLIWAGEKMEKDYPNLDWDTIMDILSHIYHIPDRWSIETYIKEGKR